MIGYKLLEDFPVSVFMEQTAGSSETSVFTRLLGVETSDLTWKILFIYFNIDTVSASKDHTMTLNYRGL
jgi:hypothetical protein